MNKLVNRLLLVPKTGVSVKAPSFSKKVQYAYVPSYGLCLQMSRADASPWLSCLGYSERKLGNRFKKAADTNQMILFQQVYKGLCLNILIVD